MFNEKLVAVANQLAGYCREGKEEEGLNTLYAEDAVSVEALDYAGTGPETHGLEGIRGKHEWWNNAHETHASSVEGPFFHGDDRFSLIFDVDVTDRNSNERMQMKEVGQYTVKDGKIVREEFFYKP